MAKIGVSVKLDVSKLDKSRFFKGQKGVYCDLTTFIDLDEKDQYDNNGFVTQKKTKDEDKDVKLPIVGNVSIFWSDTESVQQPVQQEDFDEDIPF